MASGMIFKLVQSDFACCYHFDAISQHQIFNRTLKFYIVKSLCFSLPLLSTCSTCSVDILSLPHVISTQGWLCFLATWSMKLDCDSGCHKSLSLIQKLSAFLTWNHFSLWWLQSCYLHPEVGSSTLWQEKALFAHI